MPSRREQSPTATYGGSSVVTMNSGVLRLGSSVAGEIHRG